MRHLLIIKGTRADAEAAALAHGCDFVFDTMHPQYAEAYGHTTASLAAIAGWFRECGDEPFPAGTLLWYTETN